MTVEDTPTPDTDTAAPQTETTLVYDVDPVISNLEHDVKPIVYRTKEINGIPVQLIDKRRSARKPVMEEVAYDDMPIKITDRRTIRGTEGLKEMDNNPTDIELQQEIGQKFTDNPDLDDVDSVSVEAPEPISTPSEQEEIATDLEPVDQEKEKSPKRSIRQILRDTGHIAIAGAKFIKEAGPIDLLHASGHKIAEPFENARDVVGHVISEKIKPRLDNQKERFNIARLSLLDSARGLKSVKPEYREWLIKHKDLDRQKWLVRYREKQRFRQETSDDAKRRAKIVSDYTQSRHDYSKDRKRKI